MRAGRFRGEKKVKNGFCLQRAVNNLRKAFLRVHDFAGLKTAAHFGGSCGVTADGGGWRSVGRRMVRGGHADSVRGDGGWSAEAPMDRGRKPAGGLRMACGAGRWPADGARGLVVPADGVRQLFLAR